MLVAFSLMLNLSITVIVQFNMLNDELDCR